MLPKDFEDTEEYKQYKKLSYGFVNAAQAACFNLIKELEKLDAQFVQKGLDSDLAKKLTAFVVKEFYSTFSRVFHEQVKEVEAFTEAFNTGAKKEDTFNQS